MRGQPSQEELSLSLGLAVSAREKWAATPCGSASLWRVGGCWQRRLLAGSSDLELGAEQEGSPRPRCGREKS